MSGIGWYGDLGNIQLMPVINHTDLRSGSNEEVPFKKGTVGWKSPFSHDKENAKAGYYSVFLDRYGIFAEATASYHTGLLRFTYPECDNSGIIFNFSRRIAGRADSEKIKIINNSSIEGHIHCTPNGGGFGRGLGGISYDLFFKIELSKPAESLRFISDEEYLDAYINECEGKDVGLVARFKTCKDEKITVKCSISYTDIEGAQANFNSECVELDFDKNALEAVAEKALERKTGARGLRAIMEETMSDIMYNAPSDDSMKKCVITKALVEGKKTAVVKAKIRHTELKDA
jgi:putative alpha-1,2-mannosidase